MNKSINLIALIVSLGLSSCHVGRYFTKFNANITDHKIFPYTNISTGDSTFTYQTKHKPLTVEVDNVTYQLDEYLSKTSTVSFLVIQRDTILFENYYHGYQPHSISNLFSASKSVTGLLVGIAVDEGKIKSIHEPVTNYIPELLDAHEGYQNLTIEHLLNMRSGLKFKEAYLNPFAHVARLYYGKNQLRQIKKLTFEREPGEAYNYQSISTALLGIVLERATQMELGKYLEEKVWIPLGMEFSATWSVDDKKNRSTKAYCCLNTTARDLAKVGRLYLHNGNWNGVQIVNENYILQSKTPNMRNECYQNQWYNTIGIGYERGTELIYPDSISAVEAANALGYNPFYVDKKPKQENQWHIHYCSEDFYALGILGQLLYVNPQNEIIIVRLGKKWDASYITLFRQIILQLEEG